MGSELNTTNTTASLVKAESVGPADAGSMEGPGSLGMGSGPLGSGGLSAESGLLNSRPDRRFPHPTERPGTIVLIFDGRCKFCTQQVRWLHRLDLGHRISFISLHDPFVAARWPDLTYEQLMQQIYVLPPSTAEMADQAKSTPWQSGAAGVRYLAWRVPLLWPLALLLSLPGTLPLWQAIYNGIARQRYRFGRLGSACDPDGTCHLHFGPEHLKEKKQ